jgi:hypothetical protein
MAGTTPLEEQLRCSFAGYLADDPCALGFGDRLVPPFGGGTLPLVLRLASAVIHTQVPGMRLGVVLTSKSFPDSDCKEVIRGHDSQFVLGNGHLEVIFTDFDKPFGCIDNVFEHFPFSSLAIDGEVVNED